MSSAPGAEVALEPTRLDSLGVRLVLQVSERARRRRGELFWGAMRPEPEDRILDVGSEDGSHIAALVPFRDNVWIADIDAGALKRGAERYGFHTIELDESGRLPFPDGHFDVVFCSSVLEHVSVDKGEIRRIRSKAAFERLAFERQRRFAGELRRVARRYFVQTPYRYFPIESHTWLPMPIVLLPRALQLRVIAWLNGWWIKSTSMDFNLLTHRQMQELFPDATIVPERFLGATKSLIAVRS
jgi:methyltransferase family protein